MPTLPPLLLRTLVTCFMCACLHPAQALDRAILDAPVNEIDKRNDYTNQLLTAILKKTERKYGAFTLEYAPEYMHRDRLFSELKKGVRVNVSAKATRPDWEDSELQTIRIPVDKGITEYRIFLIHKDDQDKFRKIDKLDSLRQLTLGVGHAWSSRAVFESQGFRVEPVVDWESIYRLLASRRIDYFPRALSEVFVEYHDRHETQPELAIEDSLMLYFPLPKYFFIAPQETRLARRIEEGFSAMIADGSFERLFLEYHRPLIAQAEFCKRKIFRISNPQLSPLTPLERTEYWYNPFAQRPGSKQKTLCNK